MFSTDHCLPAGLAVGGQFGMHEFGSIIAGVHVAQTHRLGRVAPDDVPMSGVPIEVQRQ